MDGEIGDLSGVRVQMLTRSMRMAIENGGYRKAEAVCNKVLALDAENIEVLLTKADAIAHQSRPEHDRTLEVIECCSLAISAAAPEERAVVRHLASRKVKLSLMFYMGFVCRKFVSVRSKANGDAVRHLPRFMANCATEWREVSGEEVLDDAVRERVSCAMEDAVRTTWDGSILSNYEIVGARSREELDEFVNMGDLCIDIIKSCIAFSPHDLSANVARYKYLIEIMSTLVDAHSIRETQDGWARAYSLSEADKELRQKRIGLWEKEMAGLDEGRAQASPFPLQDASRSAVQRDDSKVVFFGVSFMSLIANAVLLAAILSLLTQWVPSMMHGDLLCALFGVAGVAGGFSFAGCLMDVFRETPSKQTGYYLFLCAISLLILVVMGWEKMALGLTFGLAMTDAFASLYYLAHGKSEE